MTDVLRERKAYYTREQDDFMLTLWGQGYTAQKIADRMGMTRSAVMGRLHRLEAPKRINPLAHTSRPQKPPRINPVEKRILDHQAKLQATEMERDAYDAAPFLRENGQPFTTATIPLEGHCRWISAMPTADAIMCGHKTEFLRVYCNAHHLRAHDPKGISKQVQR